MTSENEKKLIRSMMECLYIACLKYPGFVEKLELNNHDTAYFITLVFTRKIQSHECVPYSHMFEAIGLSVSLSRDNEGRPKYLITHFDYLPKSGRYLPPFTDLYENIFQTTRQWATTMTYMMDSQHLATNQVNMIRSELIAKTMLIV